MGNRYRLRDVRRHAKNAPSIQIVSSSILVISVCYSAWVRQWLSVDSIQVKSDAVTYGNGIEKYERDIFVGSGYNATTSKCLFVPH